jgi:DNA-directed RNA polymerase specialized sigma24 family protein
MGLRLFPGSRGGGVAVEDETQRSRFGTYFPRVFAYVHHRTGDEGTTRELVAEAFARVFSRAEELKEDEFRLALFGAARELCDGVRGPSAEGLTERERDLVSLLFDGQLDRGEVACLMDVREETVTAELVRALKKLRAGLGKSPVPSFLRAS